MKRYNFCENQCSSRIMAGNPARQSR
ncbi:DUF3927 domain-containing protein [Neisseria sp. WF04]|nr:DUF3927 domain-containing protein [Neisseria sp. WF04]